MKQLIRIVPFLLFPFYLFLIISCSFGISFITSFFYIPYALFGLLAYKYHLTTDIPDSQQVKLTRGFFDILISFFLSIIFLCLPV